MGGNLARVVDARNQNFLENLISERFNGMWYDGLFISLTTVCGTMDCLFHKQRYVVQWIVYFINSGMWYDGLFILLTAVCGAMDCLFY
jgi:uncharacterized membrane protein